jgi:hypothetical protein
VSTVRPPRREAQHETLDSEPSPALVIAMVALLFSLTGTVVGAKSLLTGRDIGNGSLTGADIKNKSLTPKDFKGSVRGARAALGEPGAKVERGDKGDPGPRTRQSLLPDLRRSRRSRASASRISSTFPPTLR